MSKERARELRRNATPAEKEMWKILREMRAKGWHFRRQAPIGPYFADFACHTARLIIEVDGDTHGEPEQNAYDQRRSRFLEAQGYSVLRVRNADVMKNIEGVFMVIEKALLSSPHPNLPHQGKGAD